MTNKFRRIAMAISVSTAATLAVIPTISVAQSYVMKREQGVVTDAEFDMVTEGMSITQVQKIVGGPGLLIETKSHFMDSAMLKYYGHENSAIIQADFSFDKGLLKSKRYEPRPGFSKR